ncbi:hypothetical protein H9623_15190 [Oerskovia sp. Sa1BUA8]|uniref:Ig-like domain-containing protein n=1 Tax=Oerskovia douganii TaxID=2762210 RepID=A0A9D5Z0M0_9CELL|nr:hypothetical protein [Oerskovia douganii]MBE7701636.1 hypothetical protein [Oerskovia douganii]
MNRKKTFATVLVGVLVGTALSVAPAQAAGLWANCSGQTLTNGAGQSKPRISCTTMGTTTKARGKMDCTAAPDTKTAWVRAYQSSTGGYCLFGARGFSYELAEV